MKRIRNLVLLAGLLGSLPSIHAQIAALDGGSLAASPASSPASSPILAAMAETESLMPVTAADVRLGATLWLATGTAQGGVQLVPLPVLPAAARAGQMPIYQIGPVGSGQYLLDGIQTPVDAALATASVLSLMDRVQNPAVAMAATATMSMRTLGAALPAPGGGVGVKGLDTGGGVAGYAFDTNRLWLEISNVVKGTVYLNLRHATNSVYAIETTTNLLTPFTVATEIWPTNASSQPFTLLTSNRPTLFVRARDWTGVTEPGNTIPSWWLWKYFATTALSDTNLDSQGNMLIYDYLGGVDPNIIQFTLSVTNQYVTRANAPLQVNVTAGIPGYFAVLVDSTNFTDAVWQGYVSSNLTANLGAKGGWHDVWVGLRGFPSDAGQTWQWRHLNLALPPVLALTNPVGSVVSQPVIQVYGYCQEPLASISYDLSNAVGVATNQPAEVTDQYYDAQAGGFTTNYFECLDVPLTNGLNTLTIHATDLAGNTTTTNFSFTLDYSHKTNPPVMQILWPANGTQISGNTFTCRGVVNDPTATITAQVVFTNSDTNLFYNGLYTNIYVAGVERNGNFWLENLPLNAGANVFTLTAKDAAGNTSATNLNVAQSALTLTINPVTSDSQLWQSTIDMTGTISATNYAVWVNGVKGHNNGNGTWFASGVPINAGGTANFTATAYAPDERQPDGSFGN